jgi:hypothetical protein
MKPSLFTRLTTIGLLVVAPPCATLLTACGSKLTEPVKAVTRSYADPAELVNTPQPYASSQYGVPEVGRVEFNASAQLPVQDLTY